MSKTQIPTGGIADDAVGNTKLDLTANYAFTGTVTGTNGSWNKISTNTISSAVNVVEWTGIDDTYKIYAVVGNNMQLDGDGGIGFRIGTSSGYVDSAYRFTGFASTVDNTNISGIGNVSSNRWALSGTHFNFGGAGHENANFVAYFFNLRGSSGFRVFQAHTSFTDTSDNQIHTFLTGRLYEASPSAKDRIQFGNIGGGQNMDAGDFTLYGVQQ
jgi:hypothetical protein|tara:strand:+ start:626 stop:1267 length:642 start_codon:yes stop_codon:yes gene_type:complete